MSEIEKYCNKPEFKCVWTVYDLDTRDCYGEFDAYNMLSELAPSGIISVVNHNLPQTVGRNFCVNDEDMEKIYIKWDGQDNIYDEYVHTTWTDEWAKKE